MEKKLASRGALVTVCIYFAYFASASSKRTQRTFAVLNVREMWHEQIWAMYNDDFLKPRYTFNFINFKKLLIEKNQDLGSSQQERVLFV